MPNSGEHSNQHTRFRHMFNNALTAAMAMILATTVIGSATVWRNQGIIQNTRFTNADGIEMLLQNATFQTEVLRIISGLPGEDWKERVLALEERLQKLEVMVARLNGGDK